MLLRLAIVVGPLLIWGLLYLASVVGGISPIRFTPWRKVGFIVLGGIGLILFVFDRTRLSHMPEIHAWGFFGGYMWIKRRYKESENLTSLKL